MLHWDSIECLISTIFKGSFDANHYSQIRTGNDTTLENVWTIVLKNTREFQMKLSLIILIMMSLGEEWCTIPLKIPPYVLTKHLKFEMWLNGGLRNRCMERHSISQSYHPRVSTTQLWEQADSSIHSTTSEATPRQSTDKLPPFKKNTIQLFTLLLLVLFYEVFRGLKIEPQEQLPL